MLEFIDLTTISIALMIIGAIGVVLLLALIKINEVRKSKLEDFSTHDKMLQSTENQIRNSEGGK